MYKAAQSVSFQPVSRALVGAPASARGSVARGSVARHALAARAHIVERTSGYMKNDC